MATSHIISAPAHWHFALPQIVVSAGAAGAMLAITLLRESQLTLSPGCALVLHDPVGLTGDRVLAHVYREAARHVVESESSGLPSSSSLQWLQARPPLSRVWDAMDALGQRFWRRSQPQRSAHAESRAPKLPPATQHRPARGPFFAPAAHQQRSHGAVVPAVAPERATRAPRVAEPSAAFTVCPPPAPSLILLSECERIDAISPTATARLLTRALRRQWAVLAVTQEGPRHASSGQPPTPRDWCTHVVCQGGALRPVSVG